MSKCPFDDIAPSSSKPMNYPTQKSSVSSGHDRPSDKLEISELYRLYNDRNGYNSLMQRLEKDQVFANSDSTTGQLRILIYQASTVTEANGWLLDTNRLFLFFPMRFKTCNPTLFRALFGRTRNDSLYQLIEAPTLEFIAKGTYRITKLGIIKPEVPASPDIPNAPPQGIKSNSVSLPPLVPVHPAPNRFNPVSSGETRIQGESIVPNTWEHTKFFNTDSSSDLLQQVQEKLIEPLMSEIESLKDNVKNLENKVKNLEEEKNKSLKSIVENSEKRIQEDSTVETSKNLTGEEIVTETIPENSEPSSNSEETNYDRDNEPTTPKEDSSLTEEEQRICFYYNNRNQSFGYEIKTVQEAKESIAEGRIQSSLGATLEVSSNGKYWVFQTNSSNIFLVPDRDISINQYKVQTVGKLFDYNPEASSYRHFWLRKPAKLEVSGNDRWTVIEKGLLEFIIEGK